MRHGTDREEVIVVSVQAIRRTPSENPHPDPLPTGEGNAPFSLGRRVGDEGKKQSMKSKHPHYYGAALGTFEKAKALRKDGTPAEKLLWKMIRNRKLFGLKFRRQHPLKYFVADFYCHELLLAIEVDGSIHDLEENKQYDKEREEIITELGITVLRFTNEEVFSEPEKIEKEVKKNLQKK